jgi:ABC-type polysaccharide/polyol phosphate transport system ATPase subunit
MSDLAISVRDVRKKYRLFDSPMERLKEALHPFSKHYHREFWALNGVSVDIPKGQTIGILGRNGSGKSTLLQIIAGILQPTSGGVIVQGRVSALLELGAGFNPEFTGRENVMLNGAITKVPRDEMVARMPQIEAFADIGEFFDQPVKTYSSGMFVRVAFAAAINVDPDILFVDEALSVGDVRFQNKCFGKFSEFQRAGKTILFVTHNTNLIPSLCSRVLVFDAGRIMFDGDAIMAVDLYYDLLFSREKEVDAVNGNSSVGISTRHPESRNAALAAIDCSQKSDSCHTRQSYNRHETRFTTHEAEIIDVFIESQGMIDSVQVEFGAIISLFIKVLFNRDVLRPLAGFSIKAVDGIEVCGTNTFMMGKIIEPIRAGHVRIFKFSFVQRLNPGDYFIDIGIAEWDGTNAGNIIDVRRSVGHFIIFKLDQPTSNGMIDLQPAFEVFEGKALVALSERRTAQ